VLLTSWVEHNEKHGEKFNRWVEKAKNLESDAVDITGNRGDKKANEQLSQVSI